MTCYAYQNFDWKNQYMKYMHFDQINDTSDSDSDVEYTYEACVEMYWIHCSQEWS